MKFKCFERFESHLQRFIELFRFVDGAIDSYNETELPRLRAAQKVEIPEDGSMPDLGELANFANHLGRHLIVKDVINWQNGWYIAMMVTITEAYLHDALVEAAEYDPSFMQRSQQNLDYSDVVDAKSVGDLAVRMRSTWAKGFIESGGPRRWLEKLVRWGARGYRDDLVDELEVMWGIRHVMVHRSGRVDEQFLSRHGDSVPTHNGELIVTGDDVTRFSVAAIEFAGATSRYLAARCEAKMKDAK